MSEDWTPGPWKVRWEDFREDTGSVGIWSSNWGGFAAVVVQMDEEDHRSKTGEANAHLIAAAPELYKALEQVYDFIANEYGDPKSQALESEFVSPEARPIWEVVCATLARAQGAA